MTPDRSPLAIPRVVGLRMFDLFALVVVLAATIVWFATHREGNSMDNTPDGSQANPPVNGTGLWN